MSQTEIRVDYENGVLQWWDAARKHLPNAPPFVQDIMTPILLDDDCHSVMINTRDVPKVKLWCATLPYWDKGPTYAPKPLRFIPVEKLEK